MSDNYFDLEDRTSEFSKEVIELVRYIKQDCITKTLIFQLVKSATSVGANYREANHAETKQDFKHKIAICRKEINESIYWLDLLISVVPSKKEETIKILKEAKELNLIFSKIFFTTLKNLKQE